jgi:hypothetical protein
MQAASFSSISAWPIDSASARLGTVTYKSEICVIDASNEKRRGGKPRR